jgi:hypothetical protein
METNIKLLSLEIHVPYFFVEKGLLKANAIN